MKKYPEFLNLPSLILTRFVGQQEVHINLEVRFFLGGEGFFSFGPNFFGF